MKTRKFSLKSSLLAAGLFLFGTVAITGCTKSLDTGYPEQNVAVASIMVHNLATDKSVSVSISGNSLGSPLSFSSYTGSYIRIYTGNRTVEVRDANNGNTLVTTPFTFDSSRYYSAFVLGANGAYKTVIVNDDFDSLSGSSGKAYVRYINAVPDSTHPATVRVSVNGTDVSNTAAAYGTVSPFTAVAPGQVNIAINKNGISKDRTIQLEQQKVYTVLLSGLPDSNTADSMQIRYIANGTLSSTTTNGRATANNASNAGSN